MHYPSRLLCVQGGPVLDLEKGLFPAVQARPSSVKQSLAIRLDRRWQEMPRRPHHDEPDENDKILYVRCSRVA